VARRAYARRYAQAVFEIALEKNELDRWQVDLANVAGLAGDAAVIALLQDPKVPFETKAKLISGDARRYRRRVPAAAG
jgi:F0F1-type ATP synthase delta subunit